MISTLIQWQSLKTRATVFTLAIFVVGIWSLSFYVSRSLQTDMERLLGEQQFSVVTSVAKNVNNDLTERLQALQTVAKEMDAGPDGEPRCLAGPSGAAPVAATAVQWRVLGGGD